MKKIILILLTIMPFIGWGADGNYLLKGKVGKGSSGAKIHLNYMLDGKSKTISASCENGTFQFKGPLSEPRLAQLVMDPKGVGFDKLGRDADVLVIFLENGNITVNSKDFLRNAVITGSKLNDENTKLRALLTPSEIKMKSILADFYKSPANKQKNAQFKAEAENKFNQLLDNQRVIQSNYVKANPKSFLSLEILKALAQKEDLKKIKPLFNALSPELRNSPSGKAFAKKF